MEVTYKKNQLSIIFEVKNDQKDNILPKLIQNTFYGSKLLHSGYMTRNAGGAEKLWGE